MKTTIDLNQGPSKGGGSMNFKYEPESKPLDGYTIKRAIHRGGFGEVYYALSDAGKEVALKLLQANADVELRGIAQCLNLKHSNLLTIFDVKQTDAGEQFVVMEYVAGRTLGEVISEKPSGVDPEYVEEILNQLAAGADYLHERGIVHRDLKPANVYLESGTIKIGDVGLAKFISESRRDAQTQSVGTVYYMAPEIAHGRYGREVDVYALGVMVYEMLTGNVPFDGESTGEILMKQLSAEPDLSILPEKLRSVVARALAKDPEKRTSSAGEFASEFSNALHGRKSSARFESSRGDDAGVQVTAAEGNFSQRSPGQPVQTYASHERSEYRRRAWYEDPANLWIVIGGGILLLLASPVILGAGLPLLVMSFPLLLFLALLAGAFGLVRFVYRTFFTDSYGHSRGHGHGGRGVRLNSNYVRYESAISERDLSMLERVSESTGSMAVAAICAGLMAGALLMMNTLLQTPGEAMLFAIVTTLGAWAAILPAKMWEGRGGDGAVRRATTALLGGLVGLGAFAADETLMVDLPVRGFSRVAEHLAGSDYLPVSLSYGDATRLTGYAIFFGVLMLVRRWWYHVDSYRPHRFSLMSVFWTAVAGWLLSMITHFPPDWAILLAVATSTTAQLSAVWVRPEHRAAA